MAPLRWGLIGAGKISNDFAAAVATLSPEQHKMVAIGASDASKAAAFAKTFSIPKSYGSYAEVATDPDVDIVYIGTININHYELCKLVLENNKHVLCEKPLTLLPEHTEELVKLSQQRKMLLQEAVWSRFFPSYKKMREEVKAGAIGDVKLVTATFGLPIENVDRLVKRELGGGSIFDLGVYALQFMLAAFGPEMPETIKAVGVASNEGCDLATGITVKYKDGRIGQLGTSVFVEAANEAVVFGTKGSIKMPKPFWCSEEVIINGKTENFPLPGKAKHAFVYGNSEGLAYEAEECRRCIEQGLLVSPVMTHEESIVIARLQHEVLKQLGLGHVFKDFYKK